MAITYIAFIECVLEPNGHWDRDNVVYVGMPKLDDTYYPRGKDAVMKLVDIKNDRRYFEFHNHDAKLQIVNNVVIFDNDDADELAIDDSKKFPKKKRIDE